MRNCRALSIACLTAVASFFGATAAPRVAHAQPPAEAPAGPSQHFALGDVVRLTRERGYDVLAAQASVRSAEADVRTAGQLPNPLANGNVGWTLSCDGPCASGTPWGWGAGVADQGLLEGALSNKRGLRREVAERALVAVKYGRVDAERVLIAQAKIQYIQTAAAAVFLDFSREVAASLAKSVEVNRVRYPRVIDEGQLFRVEQESLRADQQVERATRDLRNEEIQLAYFVGISGPIPRIDVDKDAVKYRMPEALASSNKEALFRQAIENRPDRRMAVAREAQGEAQVSLSRRLRFPDIILNAQYAQQGTGAYNSQLPTLTVGLTVPIPIFYQQQGEIRRAEADRQAAAVQLRKVDAQLAQDIESAFNAFVTARKIVERFESTLLDRARKARDITQVQYTAGSATLTDLLDAQRSFVQVNVDYQTELVNYWTAVFQLEQAVGREFVP